MQAYFCKKHKTPLGNQTDNRVHFPGLWYRGTHGVPATYKAGANLYPPAPQSP
jgi:hypothetical protein